MAILVENFKCTDIFVFQWQRYDFSNIPKMLKFQFFPSHCPGRNAISPEVFNELSKTFFKWKKRKLATMLKIWSTQTFSFCYSNVTTFPTSWKCKNFIFSLYTVPAEMLYLQKYLTNFQKLFFRWKKRKVAFVVENFKCTDILVFQ